MVYLLMSNEKLSAKMLADKLEVSVRTVYRYIDNLSEAGIPIYASQGRNGGISLLPQFRINNTLVSEDEQIDILSSLQSLVGVGQSDQETLDKLSAIFQKKPISWIAIDPTNWSNSQEQRSTLALIKQAIFQSELLAFNYLNSKNEELSRKVYPYQVIFKDKAWYLKGYSVERKDWRLFKLNRMHETAIVSTESKSQRTIAPVTAQQDDKKTAESISLTLKIHTKMRYRLFEEFTQEQISKIDDNYYLVNCLVDDGEWLEGYLLSFGQDLQVLSPNIIQQRLKKELKNMLEYY
ncbi:helix-turn-helix transcriptional regulator [Desemzia sp. FAM 24101]